MLQKSESEGSGDIKVPQNFHMDLAWRWPENIPKANLRKAVSNRGSWTALEARLMWGQGIDPPCLFACFCSRRLTYEMWDPIHTVCLGHLLKVRIRLLSRPALLQKMCWEAPGAVDWGLSVSISGWGMLLLVHALTSAHASGWWSAETKSPVLSSSVIRLRLGDQLERRDKVCCAHQLMCLLLIPKNWVHFLVLCPVASHPL